MENRVGTSERRIKEDETLSIRRELTSEERELLADLYHFIVHNDEVECLTELKEEKYKSVSNVDITARSCFCDSWINYEGISNCRDNDTVEAVEGMIRTGYCPHAGLPKEKTRLMSFQIIHLAAIYGMTCVLEYLLTSCKVKVNCLSGLSELPPVFYAITYGNEITALYLLDMGGANHPTREIWIQNLLINAIISVPGDRVVKRLLRDKTCDVNAKDELGRTAFIVAVLQGTKDLVTLLIEAGCDVNILDWHGDTALFYAIKYKDFRMAEIVLKAGACVTVEGNKGLGPLNQAVKQSTIEITELILEAGADPNSRSEHGDPALIQASNHRNGDMVCLLLKHKADVNIKDYLGRTALFYAISHKNVGMVEILLKAGASVNVKDKTGLCPLFFAIDQSTIEITELILEAGADPNSRNQVCPDLPLAANAGDADLVRLLLKHKADVNATNPHYRRSALHAATWGGFKTCVKYLLEAGASHDQRSPDGNTPLSMAVLRGHLDIIDMLLPLGCDVTNADIDLDTPLHYAAFNGCLKTVTYMVVAGADVNAGNACDATPLWNAVHKGHTNVVRYLVRKNAELKVPSRGINYLVASENATYIYDEPKTPLATVFDSDWTGDDILIELLLMAGYDIWHEKCLIELTTTPIFSSPDVQTVFQTIMSHVFTPPSLFHLCKMSLRNTHKLRLEEFMRKQKIPKTVTNHITLEGIEKCSQKIPLESFGKIF